VKLVLNILVIFLRFLASFQCKHIVLLLFLVYAYLLVESKSLVESLLLFLLDMDICLVLNRVEGIFGNNLLVGIVHFNWLGFGWNCLCIKAVKGVNFSGFECSHCKICFVLVFQKWYHLNFLRNLFWKKWLGTGCLLVLFIFSFYCDVVKFLENEVSGLGIVNQGSFCLILGSLLAGKSLKSWIIFMNSSGEEMSGDLLSFSISKPFFLAWHINESENARLWWVGCLGFVTSLSSSSFSFFSGVTEFSTIFRRMF